MRDTPLIALLTDFGQSDAYVGTMKGIMLGICPQARLVDLTHAVEPQNIRQAAYVLLTAFRHFPPETIFLVVVDPGVGTAREPIAVETSHGWYVAPNNGVLSFVLPSVQVRHTAVLENTDYQLLHASQTFHGRDIFCPAAAHLANGVDLPQFGPPVPELIKLDDPALVVTEGEIRGEVGGMHLGEPAAEIDPRGAGRQPSVAQRIERHRSASVCAQKFFGLGVAEGEGAASGDGDHGSVLGGRAR